MNAVAAQADPLANDPNRMDGGFYAAGGYVWKAPVETKRGDGTTSFMLGFPVCRMTPEVGDGTAELIAQLMNAGELFLHVSTAGVA